MQHKRYIQRIRSIDMQTKQTQYTSQDENAIKSALFSLKGVEIKSVDVNVAIHAVERLLAKHQEQVLEVIN